MARKFQIETYSGNRADWTDSFYYRRVDTLPVHADSADWVTEMEAIHLSTPTPRDYIDVRPYTLANWNDTAYYPFSGIPFGRGYQPAGTYSQFDSSYFVDRDDGSDLYTWDLSAGGTLSPTTSNRWFPNIRPENAFGDGTVNGFYENLKEGDRHTMMWDETNHVLVESTGYTTVGGVPHAENVVSWDTTTYTLPAAATDNLNPGVIAARIPLAPFMFNYGDLVAAGPTGDLGHMVGWVANDYQETYNWPARWHDGLQPIGAPCGAVMRLKSDFDVSALPSSALKAFANTLKKYGALLYDKNLNTAVFGMVNDAAWTGFTSSAFTFDSFEFVDMSELKVADDSIQVAEPPPVTYVGALDALAARIAAL
jgi:hypothetical protein